MLITANFNEATREVRLIDCFTERVTRGPEIPEHKARLAQIPFPWESAEGFWEQETLQRPLLIFMDRNKKGKDIAYDEKTGFSCERY